MPESALMANFQLSIVTTPTVAGTRKPWRDAPVKERPWASAVASAAAAVVAVAMLVATRSHTGRGPIRTPPAAMNKAALIARATDTTATL
jgi:hypothetical protein